MFRAHFADRVHTCTMYRTFDCLADALRAIAKWEARNTPGQYRYFSATLLED